MRGIITLAIKDIRLLLRDKSGFFFTFFFPLLIAIFFGTIFSGSGGGPKGLPVLVVDEDQTDGSREYIQTLQGAEELRITESTRRQALEKVRQGKAVAFIVLKPGFGESRQRVFWGEPPELELGVDPGRRAEAGMLQGILIKYAVEGMQELFSNPDAMRGNVKDALGAVQSSPDISTENRNALERFLGEMDTFLATPVAAEEPGGGDFSGFQPLSIQQVDVVVKRKGPRNVYSISFPQGIVWGILGCAAAFGISIVTERRSGTLIRLRLAPINQLQILAGKALACFITTYSLAVFIFFVGRLIFGIQPNSYLLLGTAFLATSTAFVGIMMLLSVLGKTERSAGGIGWAILLVMSMLGGGMIPLFIMPTWMHTLSHISPVKWAMLSIEGAIWRNFSPQEMLLPCLILFGVGIVFFFIGVRAFRWSE